MTKIVAMLHGCVPAWEPGVQSIRNYVSETSLRAHLAQRAEKYGPLTRHVECDILTVDDSTMGAAQACRIARETGHDVTLFINPAQIIRNRFYWFSRLDALLDARRVASAVWSGQRFDLEAHTGLRGFRLAVKLDLVRLYEADTDGLLDEVGHLLQAPTTLIAGHAQTLTIDVVRELTSLGVQLASHGWDHREIASMMIAELRTDLRNAAAWLEHTIGKKPLHYAVPYGLTDLPPDVVNEVEGLILLANPKLPLGPRGVRQWNRQDITSDLQKGCA